MYDETIHTLATFGGYFLKYDFMGTTNEIEFHDDRFEYRAVYKPIKSSPTPISLMEGFSLRNNDLGSIPSSIMNLKGLKVLDLQNNKLSSLPDSMQSLQHLRLLDISYNNFTALPTCISGLPNLIRLNISHNPFSKFPDSVCTMLQLEDLRMSYCSLSVIPDAIGNMTMLKNLRIDSNYLSMLPKTIMNLRYDVIDLEGIQLEYLPLWLVEFIYYIGSDEIDNHRGNRSVGTYYHKFPTLMELAGRNVVILIVS